MSWVQNTDGTYQMVVRTAGNWNADNVSDMLDTLAKKLKPEAKIKSYAFWLDVGLPDSAPKDMQFKELLAYAKLADKVELVACRMKRKEGGTFMAPKLKITKGGGKGGKSGGKATVFI